MFERYFEQRRQALKALGEAVVQPHPGLAGGARELLVSEFLSAHLPPLLGIGSGQVFGHLWSKGQEDDVSRQQDVVIHRHDTPVLRIGKDPLYFAESVVATVEVRTEYRSNELEDLLDLASSVKKVSLVDTHTFQMGPDGPEHRTFPRRILCGIFFFRSPTQRLPLVERLNGILMEIAQGRRGVNTSEIRAPDFVYSLDSGLIVRSGQFDVLTPPPTGIDNVYKGLRPIELQDGAYRRVFNDGQKGWRGLNTIALEIAERCQRYAVTYANVVPYV